MNSKPCIGSANLNVLRNFGLGLNRGEVKSRALCYDLSKAPRYFSNFVDSCHAAAIAGLLAAIAGRQ